MARATLPAQVEVAVLGAGMAGLAAAERLRMRGREVIVIEAAARAGGPVRSVAEGGYLFEGGPQAIRGGGVTLSALIETLDLERELVFASNDAKKRWIYHERVHELSGLSDLLAGSLLSPQGRARLMAEPLRRAWRGSEEATLAAFFEERLGREALKRLIEPLVGGIFAGDPAQLELAAVPAALALARRGGVARGLKALPRGGGGLRSFREGLSALPQALAARMGPRLLVERQVEGLDRVGGRWVVQTAGGAIEAEALVVALPASVAAALLGPVLRRRVDGGALDVLANLPMASVATVGLGAPRASFEQEPKGFGILVAPETPLGRVQGLVFGSSIFPGRAPEGKVAVTAMVGGVRAPEAVGLSDEALVAEARAALRVTHGLSGPHEVNVIHRWVRAIPQYRPGHAAAVLALRGALPPEVVVAGAGYDGIGLGDAIVSGVKAADALGEARAG